MLCFFGLAACRQNAASSAIARNLALWVVMLLCPLCLPAIAPALRAIALTLGLLHGWCGSIHSQACAAGLWNTSRLGLDRHGIQSARESGHKAGKIPGRPPSAQAPCRNSSARTDCGQLRRKQYMALQPPGADTPLTWPTQTSALPLTAGILRQPSARPFLGRGAQRLPSSWLGVAGIRF